MPDDHDSSPHEPSGSNGHQAAPLNDYESGQVRLIAAWKGSRPTIGSGLVARIGRAVARVAERFIPGQVARAAIEKVYEGAELFATRADIERYAGVGDLAELRNRPLAECDRLAQGVGLRAQGLSVIGGAVTGVGGFLTAALDVPLVLLLSLRTILRVGHCYGYPLDQESDRRLVLGILMVAATDDPEKKRELLAQIDEVEEWMLEEAEEQVVEDEALDLLLQVEIFDDIPGVGAITSGLQNYAFAHHVSNAATRVFQEKWLGDNGKVVSIPPASPQERAVAARQGGGPFARAFYSGSYYLGFGASLPAWLVVKALGPADNAAVRGLREGGSAAIEGVDHAVDRLRELSSPSTGPDSGRLGLATG